MRDRSATGHMIEWRSHFLTPLIEGTVELDALRWHPVRIADDAAQYALEIEPVVTERGLGWSWRAPWTRVRIVTAAGEPILVHAPETPLVPWSRIGSETELTPIDRAGNEGVSTQVWYPEPDPATVGFRFSHTTLTITASAYGSTDLRIVQIPLRAARIERTERFADGVARISVPNNFDGHIAVVHRVGRTDRLLHCLRIGPYQSVRAPDVAAVRGVVEQSRSAPNHWPRRVRDRFAVALRLLGTVNLPERSLNALRTDDLMAVFRAATLVHVRVPPGAVAKALPHLAASNDFADSLRQVWPWFPRDAASRSPDEVLWMLRNADRPGVEDVIEKPWLDTWAAERALIARADRGLAKQLESAIAEEQRPALTGLSQKLERHVETGAPWDGTSRLREIETRIRAEDEAPVDPLGPRPRWSRAAISRWDAATKEIREWRAQLASALALWQTGTSDAPASDEATLMQELERVHRLVDPYVDVSGTGIQSLLHALSIVQATAAVEHSKALVALAKEKIAIMLSQADTCVRLHAQIAFADEERLRFPILQAKPRTGFIIADAQAAEETLRQIHEIEAAARALEQLWPDPPVPMIEIVSTPNHPAVQAGFSAASEASTKAVLEAWWDALRELRHKIEDDNRRKNEMQEFMKRFAEENA